MEFQKYLKILNKNKKKVIKYGLITIYIIFISPVTFFGAWIVYNDIRPPPSYTYNSILQLSHWTVVPAGDDPTKQHNSNTDMIFYKGSFWLVHAQTKWHLEDPNGDLVIWKSANAVDWEEATRINLPNTDVRDPKFADINGRLFLYFLPNYRFDPGPNTTYFTYSDNSYLDFPVPQELKVNITHDAGNGTLIHTLEGGWNFWRPKTNDNVTWYVLASGRKIGEAFSSHDADVSNTITVLLESNDGLSWSEVTEVYTKWGNGEACIEFLSNGELISTHRVGSMGKSGYALGNPDGCTLIGTSNNSLTTWNFEQDKQTRLDGSTLFSINGRIFAVGRNHLGPRSDMGNHMVTKRTAFYEVKSDKLIHLFDLPSNGDTAYTGVAIKDGWIYTSYYTNPINKDLPWFVGLALLPASEVRIARVSAMGLITYADTLGG